MNKVRTIEQELTSIDEQLSALYRKKDELNSELRCIQERELHQEIERWNLADGNCYWLFNKDNDSVYSTLYGYEIVNVRDDEFVTMIQTKYSIESGEIYLNVHEVLVSLHSLRSDREHNNVYAVDPTRYQQLRVRLLSLDITSDDLMKELEKQIVEPFALHQVE